MKRIWAFWLVVFIVFSAAAPMAATAAEEEEYAIKCTVEYMWNPEADEPIYGGLSINGYDYFNIEFDPGDIIEYEVYLEDKIPGLGNLDVQLSKLTHMDEDGYETHDWRMLRPHGDHMDQQVIQDEAGIDMDQMADLTQVAYQTWYLRRVEVPELLTEGYKTRHWAVKAGATADMGIDLEGKTATVYYKNIRVLDKDGNVKHVIVGKDSPFIMGSFFDLNGISMTAEAVLDYPGAPVVQTPVSEPETETTAPVERDNTPKPNNDWILYACIGGTALAIAVVIAAVATKKKKVGKQTGNGG